MKFSSIGELDLPITDEEYLAKSNALYMEAFPSSELLPGVERLIQHLTAHKIPIGNIHKLLQSRSSFSPFRYCYGVFVRIVQTQNKQTS